ncbi:Uncharacterized protein ToN1_04950 [Aromatoleum petrolei]|nr:Uncharacterized protein ToN1_04950 [Aromatoleum petrolei]
MRAHKQWLRALVVEIIAHVDENRRQESATEHSSMGFSQAIGESGAGGNRRSKFP